MGLCGGTCVIFHNNGTQQTLTPRDSTMPTQAWNVRGAFGPGALDHNNDQWRLVSGLVGVLCLARWIVLKVMKKPIMAKYETLATFLLQVMGGAGAVWGIVRAAFACVRACVQHSTDRTQCLPSPLCTHAQAEIVGLRVNYPVDCHAMPRDHQGRDGNVTSSSDGVGDAWAPGFDECRNTYQFWRATCIVTLAWFFAWWERDAIAASWSSAHKPRQQGPSGELPSSAVALGCTNHVLWWRFAHLVSTFVLDVCGGAGALWGASEVAGPGGNSLRLGWGDEKFGQESFDFWRLPCGIVFVLCFVRWVCQHFLFREDEAQDDGKLQGDVKLQGSLKSYGATDHSV
jgi:hypothetical protein